MAVTCDADAIFSFLVHSLNVCSKCNVMGYVNGDWDLMLEKARGETDTEKRTLLYAEIQVFLNP